MIAARFRWLRTKLHRLFRWGQQESELDAEMQFHFDQLVAEFEAEGMSKSRATAAAHREFGTVDSYREEIRDSWRPSDLADLWRSLISAIRSLARSPGFTVLAITTLALGIGANTSMFSVLNEVSIRPLPYPDSHALHRIYRATPQDQLGATSPADYLDLLEQKENFGEFTAYVSQEMNLSEPGEPAMIARAFRVPANFFDVFRIHPNLGRNFRLEEEQQGNHRVIILSHNFWQSRFGGRPDIIGHTVRVDSEPHEIIGVMPESYNDWRMHGYVNLFRPMGWTDEERRDRSANNVRIAGRVSSDLPPGAAESFIANFGEHLAIDYPDQNAGTSWHNTPYEVVKVGGGHIPLSMLVGLSGFVLLIACSNLANFLLARTIARSREFALRGALGASRLQLLRPLILESLILAIVGGLLAILVTTWTTDFLTVLSTDDQGDAVSFPTDWNVMGWAMGAAILTSVAFGIAPALYAMRLDLNQVLKSGGRGSSDGRGQKRLRHALIIGQFALAMMLLNGAVLFIRGLSDLNNRKEGWESDNLITASVRLPEADYQETERINLFHEQVLQQLQALPAVESASVSYALPFFGLSNPRKLIIEGRDTVEVGREPVAVINGVSVDYFETLGTTLRAGRKFNDGDHADALRVFVINQSMAQTLFGDTSPIGQRVAYHSEDEPAWGEIVGVVANVKSVTPDAQPITFQIYHPMAQEPIGFNEFAVRTNGPIPHDLTDNIRHIIAGIDPTLPVRKLQSAASRIDRSNYQTGVFGQMLFGFAVLGLALAALGIYGVIARIVAQRTSEFGIRLALGAQVQDITFMVLASGLKLSLAGSALGLVGAYGISRLLKFAFPSIEMDHLPVMTAMFVLLLVVALLASYLPARRASKISPVEALRAE